MTGRWIKLPHSVVKTSCQHYDRLSIASCDELGKVPSHCVTAFPCVTLIGLLDYCKLSISIAGTDSKSNDQSCNEGNNRLNLSGRLSFIGV